MPGKKETTKASGAKKQQTAIKRKTLVVSKKNGRSKAPEGAVAPAMKKTTSAASALSAMKRASSAALVETTSIAMKKMPRRSSASSASGTTSVAMKKANSSSIAGAKACSARGKASVVTPTSAAQSRSSSSKRASSSSSSKRSATANKGESARTSTVSKKHGGAPSGSSTGAVSSCATATEGKNGTALPGAGARSRTAAPPTRHSEETKKKDSRAPSPPAVIEIGSSDSEDDASTSGGFSVLRQHRLLLEKQKAPPPTHLSPKELRKRFPLNLNYKPPTLATGVKPGVRIVDSNGLPLEVSPSGSPATAAEPKPAPSLNQEVGKKPCKSAEKRPLKKRSRPWTPDSGSESDGEEAPKSRRQTASTNKITITAKKMKKLLTENHSKEQIEQPPRATHTTSASKGRKKDQQRGPSTTSSSSTASGNTPGTSLKRSSSSSGCGDDFPSDKAGAAKKFLLLAEKNPDEAAKFLAENHASIVLAASKLLVVADNGVDEKPGGGAPASCPTKEVGNDISCTTTMKSCTTKMLSVIPGRSAKDEINGVDTTVPMLEWYPGNPRPPKRKVAKNVAPPPPQPFEVPRLCVRDVPKVRSNSRPTDGSLVQFDQPGLSDQQTRIRLESEVKALGRAISQKVFQRGHLCPRDRPATYEKPTVVQWKIGEHKQTLGHYYGSSTHVETSVRIVFTGERAGARERREHARLFGPAPRGGRRKKRENGEDCGITADLIADRSLTSSQKLSGDRECAAVVLGGVLDSDWILTQVSRQLGDLKNKRAENGAGGNNPTIQSTSSGAAEVVSSSGEEYARHLHVSGTILALQYDRNLEHSVYPICITQYSNNSGPRHQAKNEPSPNARHVESSCNLGLLLPQASKTTGSPPGAGHYYSAVHWAIPSATPPGSLSFPLASSATQISSMKQYVAGLVEMNKGPDTRPTLLRDRPLLPLPVFLQAEVGTGQMVFTRKSKSASSLFTDTAGTSENQNVDVDEEQTTLYPAELDLDEGFRDHPLKSWFEQDFLLGNKLGEKVRVRSEVDEYLVQKNLGSGGRSAPSPVQVTVMPSYACSVAGNGAPVLILPYPKASVAELSRAQRRRTLRSLWTEMEGLKLKQHVSWIGVRDWPLEELQALVCPGSMVPSQEDEPSRSSSSVDDDADEDDPLDTAGCTIRPMIAQFLHLPVKGCRNDELLEFCLENGIFPQAVGMEFGGSSQRPDHRVSVLETQEVVDQDNLQRKGVWKIADFTNSAVSAVAFAVGKSVYQVLLRWHLQSGCLSCPAVEDEAVAAECQDIFEWSLTEEHMDTLDSSVNEARLFKDHGEGV
ncbi:unnamed protein product [Amoebophrya sp. A120]|nr:unnamed protein product [Amoebophrya sp. A120]|eukprot:GSA120T00025762001.1